MPTLEEISEIGATHGEQTILESKLMDYAWMADLKAMKEGKPANRLHDLIEGNYAELLKEFHDSNSPSDPGANPGS